MRKTYEKISILLASSIAALGTVPYGYRFAGFLEPNHYAAVWLGAILALAAGCGNAALGAYSLFQIHFKEDFKNNASLFLLSGLSAIPLGFICYFGYKDNVSFPINAAVSTIVTIINGAIAYIAMFNLREEVSSGRLLALPGVEKFWRALGFLIGMLVSLAAYLAAINGLRELFLALGCSQIISLRLASVLGLMAWLPYAALFSNSSQLVIGKFYHFISGFFLQIKNFNIKSFFIVALSLCAGAAFAQIAIDFFNPDLNIANFFKYPNVQNFIHYFLVPCAFLASSAVNYLALLGLLKNKSLKE